MSLGLALSLGQGLHADHGGGNLFPLIALHEKHRCDKMGIHLLSQLKGVLAGEELSDVNATYKQQQRNKLMTELQ